MINYFKIKIWFIILIVLPTCMNMCAQNKVTSTKELFDYDWKFYLGDSKTASNTTFDDTSWRTLDLPHDWSIKRAIFRIRILQEMMEPIYQQE